MGVTGSHVIANDTQTTVPHIYAAGDATEDVALVNVGEIEGRHAIERLYSAVPPAPLSYDNISTIMYGPGFSGVDRWGLILG
jgi:dihydrolipoamide dehydrogenase